MAQYRVGYEPTSLGTGSIAPQGITYTPNKADYTANGSTIPPNHLVQPGQRIVKFLVAGKASTAGTNAQTRMGAYETNEACTSEGARVTYDHYTQVTTSTTVAWHEVSVDVPLSDFVGRWIKPSKGGDGGQFRAANISGGVSGDFNTASTSFPDPFGSATNQTSLVPMVMIIEDGAGLSDINSGAAATYGQSVIWTTTGFAPNTAVVDGVPSTAVSSSGMTLPTLADGELAPRPGTRTVSASEGGTSANSTISIEAPAGFQYVQLTTQATDETRATPDEAEPGDHFMVETGDNTIAYPNGTVGTNRVGSAVAWLIKDTTKLAGQYEIIFGEGGVVLEVKRLLAFKYTAFKPTAIKPKAEKL